MIDLGQQTPLNGSDSGANGINDSGQVVGTYGTNDPMHAFLYSNGTMTGRPVPSFTGGAGCEAYAINNTGQIAGACGDASGNAHPVLWHNRAVTHLGTLGTPGNVTFTQAVSMNNNGQIAGTVFTGGASEGFMYSNGTITNLGSFLPASINDNGVMVGGPSIDSGGTVQNLNTLIPAGSPYQIQSATAINDNGQIVANATDTAIGITLGDGVQVTLSERRTVTHARARERANQVARRPFRTRSYGSICGSRAATVEPLTWYVNGHSVVDWLRLPQAALRAWGIVSW